MDNTREKTINNVIVKSAFGYRLLLSSDSIAVKDYDRKVEYTYNDLHVRSSKLADYLQNTLMMKKGDRIALCCRNSPFYYESFFACYNTGIIFSSYNGDASNESLYELINNEEPTILFYDSYYKDKILGICKSFCNIKTMMVENDDFQESDEYKKILSKEKYSFKMCDFDLSDICMLMHTGGTTGNPKAAMLSYRNIIFNCFSQQLTYHLSEADSTYISTKLFHTGGMVTISLPMLMSGARVIVQRKIDSFGLLDIIEKEKITFVLSVPTVYQRLLSSPNFYDHDLSSIKRLRCGAAPITSTLLEAYLNAGFMIYNAYGMTEVGPSNLCFPAGNWTKEQLMAKAGSVGKPMAFNEIRLVDSDGNEVGNNVIGELQFRGPLTFSGYWGKDNKDIIDENQWVSTGDLAKRDDDGFYYIVSRKKAMYISGGENIYPTEIDNLLASHPAVEDSCTIGVPDPEWGEVGKMLIVLKKGQSVKKEELQDFVHKSFSKLYVPKYIAFVDTIPKNASGKIQYKDLDAYRTAKDE